MAKTKKRFRYSIKLKAITMIAVLAMVIITVGVSYYAIMISKINKETYSKIASDIAESTAQVLKDDRLNDVKTMKNKVEAVVHSAPSRPLAEESSKEEIAEYIAYVDSHLDGDAEFEAAFEKTTKFLKDFVVTNSEFVDCLYVQYVCYEHNCFAYLCDTDETETGCHPGLLDPIHPEHQSVKTAPKEDIPPHIIKTDRYGELIIAGAPIMDGEDVVAYAMVDISMGMIRDRQNNSITRLTIYMFVTLLLIGAAGVVWVSVWLIRPLKKLTKVAEEYSAENPKETHERFQSLNIKTKDEVNDLADSVKLMENDLYKRYIDLLEVNRQLVSSREETKRMQILANQDGLTGVKNKISYNAEVARIDEDILKAEKMNFAVVMIDLNYLKDVNDTYGHDTGDVALIKLSSMVCETFKFSPVYRIGGDEFVVLCRGKDYQKVSKLVDELKRKILKSIKNNNLHDGEHISAAVGYSTFDPKEDKTVDDVFKRADRAMYENKRELKKYDK